MLKLLNIKDFVLIDNISIEFDRGLNIITGETGAGKTIIIDAIGALLGGKVSAEDIRHGAEQTVFDAVFDISEKKELITYLDSIDIPQESGEVLLKRVVSASGKSRCYVNSSIVNLSVLKSIGNFLVDIHGQNEHQYLLDNKTHVDILDRALLLTDEKKDFSDLYNLLNEKKRELEGLVKLDLEVSKEIEFLTFKAEEIERLNLSDGEEETLETEKERISHAETLAVAAREGYSELYARDDALISRLKGVANRLSDISKFDPLIKEFYDRINALLLELDDISSGLRDYTSRKQFDPHRLEDISKRLSEIKSLKRKYSAKDVSELIRYSDVVRSKIDGIALSKDMIERLKIEVGNIRGDILKAGEALATKREKGALPLQKSIEDGLRELNMGGSVRFKVDFCYDNISHSECVDYKGEPAPVYTYGLGRIAFLFSPNAGEPLRPLSKIASGGETSRLMLVLKNIFAGSDMIPTIIFDEIDTGISGETSNMLGEKLRSVSKYHQVICITHQPQIAAKASSHFKIDKVSDKKSTKVNIKRIDGQERIEELARMSVGDRITEITLRHAEEMIG